MGQLIEMPRREGRPPFVVRAGGQVLVLCDTPDNQSLAMIRSLAPVVVFAPSLTPSLVEQLLGAGASLVVNQGPLQRFSRPAGLMQESAHP
ncbi:MAG: hypothetical protein ABI693_13495 [Bryobacteraceae bacterium]